MITCHICNKSFPDRKLYNYHLHLKHNNQDKIDKEGLAKIKATFCNKVK